MRLAFVRRTTCRARSSGRILPGTAYPSAQNISLYRLKSTRPQQDDSSLISSATEWLAAMRWKAATALTSSLSSEEQKELLGRLDVGKQLQKQVEAKEEDEGSGKKDKELVMKHSIAEAVAAARAQESQRWSEKYEKEKLEIYKQAEEATRARIESDMAMQRRKIAFEEWKQRVEQEKNARMTATTNEEDAKTSNSVVNATVVDDTASVMTEEDKEEDEHHPILGPCVVDLGYKRVHSVSYDKLLNIPVWEEQRIFRHDRAKQMANDKVKTMHMGFPGVIILHEDQSGQLCVLDGQHRIGMFANLSEKKQASSHYADNMLQSILVEVYPQNKDTDGNKIHAKELFLEVNKAEPIKLVDLPGVAKASDRKILTVAADKLHESYKDMFSTSQRCRPPHLNLDNMRDALFAAQVLQRHQIKTSKALYEWMLDQNSALQEKYNADEQAQKAVNRTALKKAHKFGFYLGLDSSWYNN